MSKNKNKRRTEKNTHENTSKTDMNELINSLNIKEHN